MLSTLTNTSALFYTFQIAQWNLKLTVKVSQLLTAQNLRSKFLRILLMFMKRLFTILSRGKLDQVNSKEIISLKKRE